MKDNLEYSNFKKRSVVENIKDWILSQLIDGNLKPGDKIPTEAELADKLCVSRNSLREAIKQLEAQGIVKIKRADGTYIASDFEPSMLSPIIYSIILSCKDRNDLVSLRKAMDIGVMYIMADSKVKETDKKTIERKLNDFEELISKPGIADTEIVEKDCEFHEAIGKMIENRQLRTLYDYVNKLTVPSRVETTKAIMKNGNTGELVRLHRQLADVIFSGDKTKIEEVVNNHYVYWYNINNE